MAYNEQLDAVTSANDNRQLGEEIAAAKLIKEYFASHQNDLDGPCGTITKERVQQLEAKAAPGSEDYKVLSFVDRHYDELRQLEGKDGATPLKMDSYAIELLQDVDPSKKAAYVQSSDDGYLNNAAVGAIAGGMFGTPIAWLGTAALAATGIVTAPAWVPVAIGIGAGIALDEAVTYFGHKDASNYYDQKRKAASALLADFR